MQARGSLSEERDADVLQQPIMQPPPIASSTPAILSPGGLERATQKTNTSRMAASRRQRIASSTAFDRWST